MNPLTRWEPFKNIIASNELTGALPGVSCFRKTRTKVRLPQISRTAFLKSTCPKPRMPNPRPPRSGFHDDEEPAGP